MAEDHSDMDTSHNPPPHGHSFSRCNSSGSLPNLSTASTCNTEMTDDEDSDIGQISIIKDRRREAHTAAEQKRRDAIKKGYDVLQDLVPTCQEQTPGHKLSKATILQKSIDYIQYIQNAKKKQEEEVSLLRKETVGMAIMKYNYQQIVQAHQNQPGQMNKQIPDELKFQVFRAVMDSLFQTFDPCVHTNNFAEVSGSVISWVEEHCQPQILREVMTSVLEQVKDLDASRGQQTPGDTNT